MRIQIVALAVLASLALAGCRENSAERPFSGEWRRDGSTVEVSFRTVNDQRIMAISQTTMGLTVASDLPYPVVIRDDAVYQATPMGEVPVMRLQNGNLVFAMMTWRRP